MCVSFSIPFPNQLCYPADSFIKEVKYMWMHVSTHIGFTSWKAPRSFKFSPSDLWEFLLSHLQLVLPTRACIIDLNEWVSLCILKKMYYFYRKNLHLILLNKFLSVCDTEAASLSIYQTEFVSVPFSMRLLTIASLEGNLHAHRGLVIAGLHVCPMRVFTG